MFLIKRGRLSVQPVEPGAYQAVVKLGTEGGWQDWLAAGGVEKGVRGEEGEEVKPGKGGRKRKVKEEVQEVEEVVKEEEGLEGGEVAEVKLKVASKRKVAKTEPAPVPISTRPKRTRKA